VDIIFDLYSTSSNSNKMGSSRRTKAPADPADDRRARSMHKWQNEPKYKDTSEEATLAKAWLAERKAEVEECRSLLQQLGNIDGNGAVVWPPVQPRVRSAFYAQQAGATEPAEMLHIMGLKALLETIASELKVTDLGLGLSVPDAITKVLGRIEDLERDVGVPFLIPLWKRRKAEANGST